MSGDVISVYLGETTNLSICSKTYKMDYNDIEGIDSVGIMRENGLMYLVYHFAN